MISADALRENIAGLLGAELFTDIGEFRAAYRKRGNKVEFPVCGIYRPGNMVLTPIKGLVLASMTADVELVGEEYNVADFRQKIDTLAQTQSGQTYTIEDNAGKTYMITVLYSSAYVGIKRDAPDNTGDVYPVRMTVSYTIIQNGVSSNDVKFLIDGQEVYFTQWTVTRQRVTDIFCDTDESVMRGLVVQGGRSVDFVSPVLSNALGKSFLRATLGNENNEAHAVYIEIDGEPYSFIGIWGNTSVTAQPQQNVGTNVSLVEGAAEQLKYPAGWATQEYTAQTVSIGAAGADAESGTNGETVFAYWGDGTSDRITAGTSVSHTYTDGVYSHTVRTFTVQN